MDLELEGKSVLITGGSQGIGLCTAKAFARQGVDVHIAARDPSKLAAAADSIRAAGAVQVTIHSVDLSKPGQPQALVDACSDVDILVNNAGAIPGGSIESVDEEAWRKAWDLKVFGYINMTRAMLKPMYARKSGVIVNVIGMGGVMIPYNYICGSAGNAALIAFSKSIGSRSVDQGVRVVAVNPPAVNTERLVQVNRQLALEKFGDAERYRELTQGMPFDRPCEPEEVADLVLFAASARSSYLSGTEINLDAGMLYRRTW